MVQLGSIAGALFAFVIADRIGRIWATRVLCMLWILGIGMFMGNNGSLGLVYAGRFIAGLVSNAISLSRLGAKHTTSPTA